jgi:hypothetical protein
MARRLILGTAVVIAYERGVIDRSSLDDDELSTPRPPRPTTGGCLLMSAERAHRAVRMT